MIFSNGSVTLEEGSVRLKCGFGCRKKRLPAMDEGRTQFPEHCCCRLLGFEDLGIVKKKISVRE